MTIEVKNLFEKDVCDNIVDRLQSLSTASVRQWGRWMYRRCWLTAA